MRPTPRPRRLLGQFREARDAFKAKVDALQSDVSGSKQVTDAAMAAVSAQWTEVEMAFQQFLKTSGDQASLVKSALAARAEAQRQSFQASMQSMQASATAAMEQGREEVEFVAAPMDGRSREDPGAEAEPTLRRGRRDLERAEDRPRRNRGGL